LFLKNKLERIDENITKYLSYIDEQDTSEQNNSEYAPKQIKSAIKELTERKEKYEDFLNEMKQAGETQKLTTYPEARVMQSKDGFHCFYYTDCCRQRQSFNR
jgi:transposase